MYRFTMMPMQTTTVKRRRNIRVSIRQYYQQRSNYPLFFCGVILLLLVSIIESSLYDDANDMNTVLCRITIVETIISRQLHELEVAATSSNYGSSSSSSNNQQYKSVHGTEQICCIPIIVNTNTTSIIESDDIIPIALPYGIQYKYKKDIRYGQLLIRITNAQIISRSSVTSTTTPHLSSVTIQLNANTTYQVLNGLVQQQQQQLNTTTSSTMNSTNDTNNATIEFPTFTARTADIGVDINNIDSSSTTGSSSSSNEILRISPIASGVGSSNTNSRNNDNDGYDSSYNGGLPIGMVPMATKPIMTVLFVRISAPDSQANYTGQDLVTANFDPTGINFKTQYSACSYGQIQFIPSSYSNGYVDVMLPKTIGEYPNGGSIIDDAITQFKKDTGIDPINQLADRIVFCAPPGSGGGWMANAGVRHWRVQMNNDWCLSLTGLMHEIGHTLGLLHSHANGDPYGDRTGYMGSGYTDRTWPRKCFNAYNFYLFQWYNNRHYVINPIQSNEPTSTITVASFVDYDLTSDSDYVIINIDTTYFLQYNRAKGFNVDTEQKQDMLTITQAVDSGTDSLAGLAVGGIFQITNYNGFGKTLHIEVCSASTKSGNDGSTPIDIMKVSIGFDKSLCNISESSSSSSGGKSVATNIPTIAPATTMSPISVKPPPILLTTRRSLSPINTDVESSTSTSTGQSRPIPSPSSSVVDIPPALLAAKSLLPTTTEQKLRHDFIMRLIALMRGN